MNRTTEEAFSQGKAVPGARCKWEVQVAAAKHPDPEKSVIEALEARIAALEARVAVLEAQ